MEITNFKNHDLGIITFTRKWHLPTIEAGWGNGYIGFPVEHPNCPICDYENMPYLESNSWTYDSIETIEGISYKVYGFDTCHLYMNEESWPQERVVNVIESYVPIAINILNYAK